jgi:hypothetical protein
MSVERTNKIYAWLGMGFLLTLPLFYFDFSPKDNIELRKGISVIRYMSAPRQLKRSGFSATFSEGNAEQFVEWMFSPMGSAIWPPVEGGGEFSHEEEKMIRKTGMPFLPPGISIVPNEPDLERGPQVVVSGDDERQMLVAEGYVDPQEAPVLIKEWEFILAGSSEN